MKSKWTTYSLGKICEEHGGLIQTGPFGSQLHHHDYVESGIPVVMPKDIKDGVIDCSGIARISAEDAKRLAKHQVVLGDVVIPRRGEISKCALIRETEVGFLCGTGCLKITPPSSVLNSSYFKYFLGHADTVDWLESNAVGATMLNLSAGILKKLPVILPDLVSQRKIGSILSAYDDLIENNLQRIKLLEEMAQITYEEWFVRMKFPGHETAQWDKETGLPEGWAKIPLGNIMIFHYGKGLRSHEKREGNVPIYSSAGIFGYHDTSLVDAPGIIVGRKGNVGSVFWSQEPFFPMDTTYYIESKESLYFAYFALKGVEFINNDAAVPGLNRSAAYAMKIISPVSELIERFEERVKPAFVTVFNLKKQNELLREAREILLPRLMTGVIDVDQVEVPEALLARVG